MSHRFTIAPAWYHSLLACMFPRILPVCLHISSITYVCARTQASCGTTLPFRSVPKIDSRIPSWQITTARLRACSRTSCMSTCTYRVLHTYARARELLQTDVHTYPYRNACHAPTRCNCIPECTHSDRYWSCRSECPVSKRFHNFQGAS